MTRKYSLLSLLPGGGPHAGQITCVVSNRQCHQAGCSQDGSAKSPLIIPICVSYFGFLHFQTSLWVLCVSQVTKMIHETQYLALTKPVIFLGLLMPLVCSGERGSMYNFFSLHMCLIIWCVLFSPDSEVLHLWSLLDDSLTKLQGFILCGFHQGFLSHSHWGIFFILHQNYVPSGRDHGCKLGWVCCIPSWCQATATLFYFLDIWT